MEHLPLEGINVLEVAHIVAGPSAGMILADMGADVVKVEPPDALDPNRRGSARTGSFYFLNRNKRSIVIDLKHPDGLGIFLNLADNADVVVENMGPGAMDRLGVGYDQVSQRNPRIIYCSVKGFLSGPYAGRPFLDELAQMMSGLAYMTGPPGQPLRAGASIVDIGAATYAVLGVLGALLQRHETGRGQKITGGLFETALFYVGQHMGGTQYSGEPPTPMAARDRGRGWSIYDLFECGDGRQVFVGITSNPQWQRLCHALGIQDLAGNPDMADNVGRLQQRPVIIPRVTEALSTMNSGDVVQLLVENGIPVAPLNTPATVIEDPALQSDNRLVSVMAEDKALQLPLLPYETSAYRFSKRYDPPALPGRDTRDVLLEKGYAAGQVDALLQSGAIKTPAAP